MVRQCLLLITAFLYVGIAQALTYEVTPGSDLVGEVQYHIVEKGDTFADIARKFDVGYIELHEANPNVDPKKPLANGTQLLIPTEFILPAGVPHEGIVLNLAELRLYYFVPNSATVVTFPVGLGQMGWKTPVGQTEIVKKRENPVWIPPDSIRAEAAAKGRTLPAAVPAGPNNPLGKYALNLGWTNYRMHGTIAPSSIGTRASHGCIRMFPEDIESLFNQVDVGTKVNIIHEPFKIGMKDGELYLEAHQSFPETYYTQGDSEGETLDDAWVEANYSATEPSVNWSEIKKLIKETYGYPVKITTLPQ